MAETGIIIKLSLKDADTVKRGLEAIGADGEKALRRLDAAARAPTVGMQALASASTETRNALGGLASQAGVVGSSLSRIGAGGLALAAGLGVALLALTAAVQRSREAIQFFGELADSADRVGTTASRMEALNRVALENAGSVEKLGTALESLQVNAQKAVDGDAALAAAFARNGVSMEFLKAQGGDTVVVFNELSKSQLSAADAAELMGKAGKSLLPTMQGLHGEIDGLSNTKLDPLAKEFDKVSDASAILDRKFNELGTGGTLLIQQQFLAIKQALFDLEEWFLKTAEANHQFWEGLRTSMGAAVAQMSGTASLIEQAKQLEGIKPESGGLQVELNTPSAPPPAKPLAPSGGGVPPRAPTSRGSSAASSMKSEIDALDKYREAWLKADGDISESIEQRRQHELRAAEETIHDATRLGEARQLINQTFDLEQVKSDADKNLKLGQAAVELQNQLEKIDQDIASQRIAAMRDAGKGMEAAQAELQQRLADIQAGGGTEDQQRQLSDLATRQIARSDAMAGELSARQETLELDKLELSLMDETVQKRAELLAAAREELELRRQFPLASEEEIASLKEVAVADAGVKAQIAEKEQAEKDFNTISRQGIDAIASGFEDVILSGKKFDDVLAELEKSFEKLLVHQLITKPLEKALDTGMSAAGGIISKWFASSADAGGTVGGLSLEGGPAKGGFETSGFQTTTSGGLALAGGAGADLFGGLFDSANASADATSAAAEEMSGSADDLGRAGAAGDLSKAGGFMATSLGQALTGIAGGGGAKGGGGGIAGIFGSFLGSAIGAYFGRGAGAGTGTGVSPGAGPSGSAGGYQYSGSSQFILARGGTIDRGELMRFASGGVVDRPMLFPMARGTGLMGESGPEAVMPLKRLPSGNLGVQASSGQSSEVNITINNNAPVEVKQDNKRNDRGGLDIEMSIDPLVAAVASRQGSLTNRVLQQSDNKGPRR